MGWLFTAQGRDALVEELLNTPRPRRRVLEHSLVGNRLWVLFETSEDDATARERAIMLFLLEHGGNGSWGYKAIHESMGPAYYGCPKRILDRSTCRDGHAVKWRAECAQERADRKRRREYVASLKPGDTFTSLGRRVVLADFQPPGLGRNYVAGYMDGKLYKWATSNIDLPHRGQPALELAVAA